MSRLDTIRAYFADRFFTVLVNDPRFAALQYPAELFSGPGQFTVPSTVAGLTQIPTIANLNQRIASATGTEKTDLQTFLAIEIEALDAIVPGLATLTSSWGTDAAGTYAPIVHHPDDQNFFPAAMHDLLNYTDGLLTARYYSSSGQQALPGQVFQLMFDNPEVVNAAGQPAGAYQAREPFTATIGTAPPVTGYPADPASAGRLNLGPASGRLGPGRLAPTMYAEIKDVGGALKLNQAYHTAALMGGQYAPLRNNRIHTDPLPGAVGSRTDPGIMIVYHGFYPADDEAQRRPGVGATNREFHHLGFGVLIPSHGDQPLAASPAAVAVQAEQAVLRPTYMFVCSGPDTIRMFPWGHPAITLSDDQGQTSPNGTHANIYFANMSPAGWVAYFDNWVTRGQPAGAAVADYLGPIGAGALVGTAIAPGIGTAIGAAVVAAAELIYLLIGLFCALFGCSQEPPDDPGPGEDDGDNVYTQSANVLSPPGVQAQGPGGPTRQCGLTLIPHFPDRNLYGINAGGDTTIAITSDDAVNEILAWLGFPAGLGYQFKHTVPGPTDVAGSSLRNYFDLFASKLLEVEAARSQVTYFA
jgi:hypothetical protein